MQIPGIKTIAMASTLGLGLSGCAKNDSSRESAFIEKNKQIVKDSRISVREYENLGALINFDTAYSQGALDGWQKAADSFIFKARMESARVADSVRITNYANETAFNAGKQFIRDSLEKAAKAIKK